MTMTHKEALVKALDAFEAFDGGSTGMDRAIRRYLSARKLALVPKEPTSKMTRVAGDNLFAGMDRLLERAIAAAPDPFGGE